MFKRNDKKRIIIILSNLSWDFPCDYLKQTSLELVKNTRVVVFNPIILPSFKQWIFQKKFVKPFIKDGIEFFPSVIILPFQRFTAVRRLTIRLNFFVFRLWHKRKYGDRKLIFWCFSHSISEGLPYFKKSDTVVYDRVDNASSLDFAENKQIEKQDKYLLKKANYVFVNSPYTLSYARKFNKNVFLVPCGCNLKLFSGEQNKLSTLIEKIKKPRIGLVGSLDHRLDFKILYPLMKNHAKWNFIFIGSPFSQELTQFKLVSLEEQFEKLRLLPNTYFLGQQSKEDLPRIVAGFDVCLIPYDVSQESVVGCNPMKLYEYLAMGKPVVSTPIPAVEVYAGAVKIGKNYNDFERAIEQCLKQKGVLLERKKIARQNSWEEKVSKMRKLLNC